MKEKGCTEILLDYHLRVGQLTQDTRLPEGHAPHEQRLNQTEVGAATTVTLIDAKRPPEWVREAKPDNVARWLGLTPDASALIGWDMFDAILTPGDIIVLVSWPRRRRRRSLRRRGHPEGTVRGFAASRSCGTTACEAPQYYPDGQGRRDDSRVTHALRNAPAAVRRDRDPKWPGHFEL
jgi:hypothetical protein